MSYNNDERFPTILRIISQANRGTDQTGLFARLEDICEEMGDAHTTKDIIKFLLAKGYIRSANKRFQEIHGSELEYKAYQITELGKTQLQSRGQVSGIHVGDNVNFALNSPNTSQSIRIENLEPDLKTKIFELEEAIKSKNSSVIKKTFAYIADKSVDVAIGLLTGSMLR